MIINTDEIKNIYVSSHYVDMRKSIDGLTQIVNLQFQMNVLDHSLFIFTNKARNTQLNWLLEGLEFEEKFKEKQLLI